MSLAPYGDHTYMSHLMDIQKGVVEILEGVADALDLDDTIEIGANMAEAHAEIERGEMGDDVESKAIMHHRMLTIQGEMLLERIVKELRVEYGILVPTDPKS